MKNYSLSEILENNRISENIFSIVIKNKMIAQSCKAGQFVEIYLDNYKNLLPRPFAICDVGKDGDAVRLVYQLVGEGTEKISQLKKGKLVRILGPLGNGFELKEKENIAIIGGGIGIPPLMQLTKKLVYESAGANIDIFLGYRDELFLNEEFKLIRSGFNDVRVHISTDDGSAGYHGNVVSHIKSLNKKFDIIYACGPRPMLKAVSDFAKENGGECQISCEERMACGFGVCVGCVIKIKDGDSFVYKKVCKDGPVFESKEVLWDE